MRRPLTILCALAQALTPAASRGDDGGGSGGGGGGGDRLTEAEFSAEGKKICQEGADRTEKLVREEIAKPEVQKMDETERNFHVIEKNKPIVEDTMAKLEALKAPEEVKSHVKTLTDGVREVQDLVTDIEDEQDAAKATPRLEDLAEETRSAAKAAGLEACLPESTS